MIKPLKFGKIATVVMMPFILFLLSGCVTTRTLSDSDLPYPRKCHYVVHCNNTRYQFENIVIDGISLSGNIVHHGIGAGEGVHIYLNDQKAYNITAANTLSISLDNISKVKAVKFHYLETALIGILAIPVLAVVSIAIGGGYGM
jgi:hypothetical protein